jgi:hypothetical protein
LYRFETLTTDEIHAAQNAAKVGDYDPFEKLVQRSLSSPNGDEYFLILMEAVEIAAHYRHRDQFMRWVDAMAAIPSLPAIGSHRIAHCAYLTFRDYPFALRWIRRAIASVKRNKRSPYELRHRSDYRQLELVLLALLDAEPEEFHWPLWELSRYSYASNFGNGRLLEAMRLLVPRGLISQEDVPLMKQAWGDLAQCQRFDGYDAQEEMDELESLIAQVPADATGERFPPYRSSRRWKVL